MKHVVAALLALTLLSGSALAEMGVNPTDVFVGRWKDSRVKNAELTILPEYVEEEGADYLVLFPAVFTWKDTQWTMTAGFNADTNRLEYVDGAKTQNGKKVWNDATGTFELDGKGRLSWVDSGETDAAKLSFERDVSPAPKADALVENLFLPVAGLERGTAGAALKAAKVIVQVVGYAGEAEIWNADGEAVQDAVAEAWDKLSEDEQTRFDAAFIDGVSDPADEAFDDYDSVKRVLGDAGVSKDMARLIGDPRVRLSWEMLSSAVLNMGNIDDRVFDGAVG